MPARKHRLRSLILSAVSTLTLLGLSPASAETLQEALVNAYNSNPTLLAERARLRATDEELARANSGWRPNVTINGSATYSRDFAGAGHEDTKGWSANVVATQPLYEGGRVGAQRDIAKAQIRAGRASLAGVESSILYGAVTSYMDVVRDGAVVGLSKRQVEVLERERQASQDRFDVGEITRTDVAQAEARLSGARTTLIQTQAQLEASRAAYIRIVGRAPNDLDGAPPMPVLPRTLDEAIKSGLTINPTLVAARESQLAAQAAVDLALSALLPTVSLEGRYARGETSFDNPLSALSNRDTNSATLGIGATVPLYQGGGEYASIRQAKQTNSQSRLAALQTERDTVEQVTNAWEALEAARSSISSAQSQVNASEIAFEGVQQEADVGARTTLDVLNAEQELLNARVTLITNQRNEYVAAYALLASMGRMNAVDLRLPVKLYNPKAYSDEVADKLIGVGDE